VTGSDAPQAGDRRPLAGSDVEIPPLGVGTWAWGDRSTWGMGGYDTGFSESSIREAWEASLEAGVVLFDTAEVYGDGESERILGRLLAADPQVRSRVVLASKFMPAPWKRWDVRKHLPVAARASTERLGVEAIDLYQIHGPISLRSADVVADALAAAHGEGLIKAIGVSNHSAKETRAIDRALRERGLRLASNQVEYSILHTFPEQAGLLETCRELGVVPLAYSPIGQGRLTGKYSAANPPAGRRTFSDHPMEQVDGIVAVLRRIGAFHERTPSQVALAWCIAKGTVPIPGAKDRRQAEENAGALGWSLSTEDLAAIDAVALYGLRRLRDRLWQHG
jgi:aryl-alcohol dehydrogenase-like predicted oxidoreductase